MADTKPPPAGTPSEAGQRAAEEALFYHEADLNAAWTGARLALGGLSFLFGAFLFAYFYLRSLNSNHLWHPAGPRPHVWLGLVLGVAAVGLQIWELDDLNFAPGSSGFASVFTGFYPVFLTIVLCAMIWLEILLMRARRIPAISFVEQPPTYSEAFTVQRFQAALSAFTVVWNYLAVVAILFWVLFYLL
jgi:hypothetical protein